MMWEEVREVLCRRLKERYSFLQRYVEECGGGAARVECYYLEAALKTRQDRFYSSFAEWLRDVGAPPEAAPHLKKLWSRGVAKAVKRLMAEVYGGWLIHEALKALEAVGEGKPYPPPRRGQP
ncbi:hypothetical protein ODS41_09770 [Pyrobaculum sp. 3827-6]|jgi:hypothetical protein|uniref:hypothetical protein n=1 Tax=Pyrobaculum sp. 3827-6 TaxID=2983604 RepID=UPI0021D94702|nr:hypothetical protein [Pyrobaculum sp. 3827-6]MCU7788196.1 hypothetical protein [Pyrobaculum sp. 3827-6]